MVPVICESGQLFLGGGTGPWPCTGGGLWIDELHCKCNGI